MCYVALATHVHCCKNCNKSKQSQQQSLALRFIPAKNENELPWISKRLFIMLKIIRKIVSKWMFFHIPVLMKVHLL